MIFLPAPKPLSKTENRGTDIAAPSQKTHQRPSYGLGSFALSGFCRNPAKLAPRPCKPLARYGAMEGRARSRLAAHSSRHIPRIDRPAIRCNKSRASEAPHPGRHHVGIPGDIISECPGDFVGIRTSIFSPSTRPSPGISGRCCEDTMAISLPCAKQRSERRARRGATSPGIREKYREGEAPR
jgi:hypothetical protein